MKPFKFVKKTQAIPEPPCNETTRLIEKADSDKMLTYEESVRLARSMYGVFGHGNTYRRSGWQWTTYIARQMDMYIARFVEDTQIYYATDPNALAEVLLEMELDLCWLSKLDLVWLRGEEEETI